jgi:hypothetical protein
MTGELRARKDERRELGTGEVDIVAPRIEIPSQRHEPYDLCECDIFGHEQQPLLDAHVFLSAPRMARMLSTFLAATEA